MTIDVDQTHYCSERRHCAQCLVDSLRSKRTLSVRSNVNTWHCAAGTTLQSERTHTHLSYASHCAVEFDRQESQRRRELEGFNHECEERSVERKLPINLMEVANAQCHCVSRRSIDVAAKCITIEQQVCDNTNDVALSSVQTATVTNLRKFCASKPLVKRGNMRFVR
jgi:hypothetical protein